MKKSCYKFFIISIVFSTPIWAQKGVVIINKSAEIEHVLELRKKLDKSKPFIRIQIYNGNRLGAINNMSLFKEKFPGEFAKIKYQTPNYKVWVGKFKNKLEADRRLVVVKNHFPNAFIFRPLIRVN